MFSGQNNLVNTLALEDSRWTGILRICMTSIGFGFKIWASIFQITCLSLHSSISQVTQYLSLMDSSFLKLLRNSGNLLSSQGAVLFQSSTWKELISPSKVLILITYTVSLLKTGSDRLQWVLVQHWGHRLPRWQFIGFTLTQSATIPQTQQLCSGDQV